MNVLLVDDEEDLLEVLEFELEEGGIDKVAEIILVNDPLQALEVVKEKSIDVILSDINMPGMNGIEFVKKIQAEGFTNPVMMLSAHGDPATVQKTEGLNIFKFVQKPFKSEELIAAISQALEVARKS